MALLPNWTDHTSTKIEEFLDKKEKRKRKIGIILRVHQHIYPFSSMSLPHFPITKVSSFLGSLPSLTT